MFETDCKSVADAFNSRRIDVFEFGAIVSSARSMVRTNESFIIKYVRRDANIVAHRLPRIAKDLIFPRVWKEPRRFVEGLIHNPCNCSQ